jgi:hypothetical protein
MRASCTGQRSLHGPCPEGQRDSLSVHHTPYAETTPPEPRSDARQERFQDEASIPLNAIAAREKARFAFRSAYLLEQRKVCPDRDNQLQRRPVFVTRKLSATRSLTRGETMLGTG